jgi:hypothetical protein
LVDKSVADLLVASRSQGLDEALALIAFDFVATPVVEVERKSVSLLIMGIQLIDMELFEFLRISRSRN